MATNQQPMLPSDVDVSKITFGAVRQLNNGGRMAYVNYGDRGRVLIQTPLLKATFGVSHWPGENGAPDKYNLDLSLGGESTEDAAMRGLLAAVDARVVQHAFENCQAWFKKRMPSIEVVEALYTRSIKPCKDRETGEVSDKYPPTTKFQLPTTRSADGSSVGFDFPAFNGLREQVDFMDMVQSGRTKGAMMKAIVQLTAVWIVGSKFGLTFKVKQLKVVEALRLSGYSFVECEEDVEIERQARAARAAATASQTTAAAKKAVAAAEEDLDLIKDEEEVDYLEGV